MPCTAAHRTSLNNPLKYRGYYYDSDLGLYYLQSRYYDANTCRFINADGYVSTGQGFTGYNMFAYCNNNPVMYRDDSGNSPSHVMVCLMDGGPSATRYSSSLGDVLIFPATGMNDDTKEFYANAFPDYIIVFDQRHCNADCNECNPNMQVWNSYEIKNRTDKIEILEILYAHDQANPSRHTWDRTVDSMLEEWNAHNHVLFAASHAMYLGVKISDENIFRLKHVDFDFNDKNTDYWQYWDKALKGVY